MRILVVEDTELVRRVIQAYLEKLGYQADYAADCGEALKLFKGDEYSLVLMDCQLPDGDGVEALRLLREQGERRVPVIALSASAPEARRCVEAGMDDFLLKPFTIEQLAGILKRWLPGPKDEGLGNRVQGMNEAALIALDDYERNGDRRLSRIARAVEALDLEEVARGAHSFRPINAYLGATRMVELLAEMEERAKGGDSGSLPGLFRELLQEYGKVKSALPEIRRRLEGKND
ncbi:MAG: response regulator [Thermacetogeniaceae bacterium]